MQSIGESLMDYTMTACPEDLGIDHPHGPDAAIPAGERSLVIIAIDQRREWDSFCQFLGIRRGLRSTTLRRGQFGIGIRMCWIAIAAWTQQHPRGDYGTLQQGGNRCRPVMREPDLLVIRLACRGFFQVVTQAELDVPYPASCGDVETPTTFRRPRADG